MMEDDNVAEEVEIQEPATANGTSAAQTSGVNVAVGKFQIHVTDRQLPLVGVFSAAMVLLIAVCVSAKGDQNYAYGISVAVVAMFFSLLGFMLTLQDTINDKFANYNHYFLLLWCFVGACILTFSSPFTATSNGYFASWGLVIFSLMGVGISGNSMAQSVVGLGSLLGLGFSAIIVIVASVYEINGSYKNESIYALVVACLTVIIVAIFCAPPEKGIPGKTKFYVLPIFSILWIVLAFLVTFRGPFLITGNGYFGSWSGAVTSVLATMSALKE